MNKTDLVSKVKIKYSELTQTKAQDIVEHVFEEIEKALAKGEQVNLAGFGIFEVRKRAARTGRNPQTGEEIKIPAKKAVAFKPAAALKRSVES